MKIRALHLQGSKAEAEHAMERRDALALLTEQPRANEKRPCPGCSIRCSCEKRSKVCCCQCSARCPAARFALTSEDEYPIEPGVLPIVYGLACLRVTPACWSCEGHLRANGEVHRLPQIWFYSKSGVYPQLVATVLSAFRTEKILDRPWQVSVAPARGDMDVTYVMKPSFELGESLSGAGFARLQRDLLKIGDFIESRMRDIAKRELLTLEG